MTGDEAIAALPDKVRVGGHDFSIIKWRMLDAEGAGRYGEFSPTEQSIRIRERFATPSHAVDTFMHEVVHAIYRVWCISDDDKEERIAGALGTGLTALHRDNPWLAGWLSEALKD